MRLLLILTVLFLHYATLAQTRKKPYPEVNSPKEWLQAELANECFVHNKYSRIKRLAFYPFNKAASIKIISFDSEKTYIPVKQKVVDYSKTKEQKTLSHDEIDSLTKILYNIGSTPVEGLSLSIISGTSCYEPRNGILFLNASGKVFEFIEICFACEGRKKSSKSVRDGEYCASKFDLLRTFFLKLGLTYGTNDRNPILSYADIFKLDTAEAISEIENKLSKKTRGGLDISQLGEVERWLFFLFSADKIYDYGNGFTKYYFNNSANFYSETIDILDSIGAKITAEALKASLQQWPETKFPKDLATRRRLLLSIVNQAEPEWVKLEKNLYTYENEGGAAYITPKESLDDAIYQLASAHRNELKDY